VASQHAARSIVDRVHRDGPGALEDLLVPDEEETHHEQDGKPQE
jgi:hypothetical protein